MSFEVINILDMIEAIGEDETNTVLSEFSCAKNKEIESFIHNNAIDFAKKKMSITYLVYSEEGNMAGIFTLAHKALDITDEGLSKTAQKKLRRFSHLDKIKNRYNVSAFLIGQLGKNDNYSDEYISDITEAITE